MDAKEPLHHCSNPRSQSAWIRVGAGSLRAAGAPSPRRLARWVRQGVTDLVTLQRAEEMRPFLPEACAELGLDWHHFPLSGRQLNLPIVPLWNVSRNG
jgi:hypothetical protein